jgi:Asp-tRNA(Asn)/Glu-tRNA(Gln) amidotransferase A subunit family amidase
VPAPIQSAASWRNVVTIQSAAADLRRGRLTSTALCESLIATANEVAYLGAFSSVDADAVLEAARRADATDPQGPLHGVPLVIKDNIHVAGLPNTAGTAALSKFIPTVDAQCVTRLRSAGAIIFGKTRLHELAFGATSDTAPGRPIRNAVDRRYCAGGSSGGTAVAIAAGAAIAGLGTDTGGSVRIPAALNGIVGFRPSTGRYPGGGTTPLSRTRDTIGPMTRTVGDAVLLDGVLAQDDAPLKPPAPSGLVVGIGGSHFTEPMDSGTALVWQCTLDLLADAGVTLVPVPTPGFGEIESEIGVPITLFEARNELTQYARSTLGISLAELIEGVSSPDVRSALESSVADDAPDAISAQRYTAALRRRRSLQQQYAGIFRTAGMAAMIFPTTPLPASRIPVGSEVEIDGQQLPTFLTYIRNTGPGTLAGLPGLTVPAGCTAENLPVGVAIDGPAGSDRRLLAVGLLLEQLLANATVTP